MQVYIGQSMCAIYHVPVYSETPEANAMLCCSTTGLLSCSLHRYWMWIALTSCQIKE